MKRILFIQHFLVLAIMVFSIKAFSQSDDAIDIFFIDEEPLTYQGGGGDQITLGDFPLDLNQDSLASIIRKEFAKYPKGVLEDKAFLGTVVISAGIFANADIKNRIYGTYIMGSDSGNYVMIDGLVPSFMPLILHHEVSSVLMHHLSSRSPTFKEREKLLRREFAKLTDYFSEDGSAAKDVVLPGLSSNEQVLGRNGYAMDSPENDFNTIMECLFAPQTAKRYGQLLLNTDMNLWEFLDFAKSKNYPVYQKVKLAIDYYHSIHPAFTEEYFRKLEVMDR